MNKIETNVKTIDCAVNCIPGANTANSALQAMYKLACKVNTLNPVTPGPMATVKIHVLNKSYLTLFFEALPVIGNLIALVKLVRGILYGFEDDLTKAVRKNEQNLVEACLANHPLDTGDSTRADRILKASAASSTPEIFQQILASKQDWSAQSLAKALPDSDSEKKFTEDQKANANSILKKFTDDLKLGEADIDARDHCISVLNDFLAANELRLAEAVINILPKGCRFEDIQSILLRYLPRSCGNGDIWSEGSINLLISQIEKPSTEQLKNYFDGVVHNLDDLFTLKPNKMGDYRAIYCETFDQLIDLAQMEQNELNQLISTSCESSDKQTIGLVMELTVKRRDQLTEESKKQVLAKLLDSLSEQEKMDLPADLFINDSDSEIFISLFAKYEDLITNKDCVNMIIKHPFDEKTPSFIYFAAQHRPQVLQDLVARLIQMSAETDKKGDDLETLVAWDISSSGRSLARAILIGFARQSDVSFEEILKQTLKRNHAPLVAALLEHTDYMPLEILEKTVIYALQNAQLEMVNTMLLRHSSINAEQRGHIIVNILNATELDNKKKREFLEALVQTDLSYGDHATIIKQACLLARSKLAAKIFDSEPIIEQENLLNLLVAIIKESAAFTAQHYRSTLKPKEKALLIKGQLQFVTEHCASLSSESLAAIANAMLGEGYEHFATPILRSLPVDVICKQILAFLADGKADHAQFCFDQASQLTQQHLEAIREQALESNQLEFAGKNIPLPPSPKETPPNTGWLGFFT